MIRSKGHISYVKSILEGLVKNGHQVTLSFDSFWTSKNERKGQQDYSSFDEWVASNQSVTILPYNFKAPKTCDSH